MTIKLPLSIGVRGRYKAIVRDSFGNVKEETQFGDNLITTAGIDYFFISSRVSVGPNQLLVVSPDNTPPTMGDTVMGDALGYADINTSTIQTASNADPLNGPIFRTVAHTKTFSPGSFGGSSVNISKAGIVATVSSTPNLPTLRSNTLLSAGLLVDNLGNPTSVSVLPTDYLDMVWEYTEFYTYDLSDTFVLDDNGTPVNIDITVRPSNCFSVSADGWGSVSNPTYYFFAPSFNTRNALNVGDGGTRGTQIGYLATGLPAATSELLPTNPAAIANRRADSITPVTYVPGTGTMAFTCSWGPGKGNASPHNNVMRVALGNGTAGVFAILFNPPITKTSLQQLELVIQVSMANV